MSKRELLARRRDSFPISGGLGVDGRPRLMLTRESSGGLAPLRRRRARCRAEILRRRLARPLDRGLLARSEEPPDPHRRGSQRDDQKNDLERSHRADDYGWVMVAAAESKLMVPICTPV
jgi:hypothetical protein